MRHDAGACVADSGGGRQHRAARFSAAFLVVTAADCGRLGPGHGWPSPAMAEHDATELAGTGVGNPHRVVGGLAVLCAWLAVGVEPQPQHVDPDRAGHGRRLWLQRGGGAGTPGISGLFYLDGARRGVLRGGGRHHFTHPDGPDARTQGALANLGSDQIPARSGTQDRPAHPRRRRRRRCALVQRACGRQLARAPG